LVEKNIVSEERIDESVAKLLKEKFLLGLFDNPFVNPAEAEKIVGQEYFVRKGQEAQRRASRTTTPFCPSRLMRV
jgi:beta-glucosidase